MNLIRIIYTCIFLLSSGLIGSMPKGSIEKETIILLSSTGGGGHISAAKAVHEQLHDRYNLITIYPLAESDSGCLKRFGGSEQFYNYLLRNGQQKIINTLAYYVGRNLMDLNKMETCLREAILHHHAVAIISVIPYATDVLFKVATEAGITALALILDFDPVNFITGVKTIPQNCSICVPYHYKPMMKQITTTIPHARNRMVEIGFPVRQQFFLNNNLITQKYKQNCLRIVIIMGAQGGTALRSLTELLAPLSHTNKIALTVIAGKDDALKKYLTSLSPQFKGAYQVRGFIEKIAPLMQQAHLVVTKPGGLSVMETLHVGTPVLLDTRGHVLTWEQGNANFVATTKTGWCFNNDKEFTKLITTLSKDKRMLKKAVKAIQQLHKKSASFDHLKSLLPA